MQGPIVHVYKDFWPVQGGIEHHVGVLCAAQAAAGHEVAVVCCAPAGEPSSNAYVGGVRVCRMRRWATVRSMPLSPGMERAIRRLSPGLVHVHSPFPLGELAAPRALPLNRPLVITHHSDVVRQRLLMRLYAPLYRRVLRRVDRIICTSDAYRDSSPWLAPHLARCRTVPLGVDTQRFSPDGPAAEPVDLLFMGRLRYYKGLDTLLSALPALPDIRLAVAGDGPMRGALEDQARALGLLGRVRFVGNVEDAALPALYRSARVFVLPANCRAEAFGTVLLEAMACGLPCVTTELGTGTSWVVQDGICGRVVPPSDPEALACALRGLLGDGALWARMSTAARVRVQRCFSLQTMLKGVDAVYGELL